MQKPHKKNYLLVKFYWPIALLDTIRKILESILAKKISAIVEINHLLLKTHFEEKKNTSPKHTVHYLVETTYAAWSKGKEASAFMLDVTSAFNNVSHSRLIQNLQKR